jgi:hypothetical protein
MIELFSTLAFLITIVAPVAAVIALYGRDPANGIGKGRAHASPASLERRMEDSRELRSSSIRALWRNLLSA